MFPSFAVFIISTCQCEPVVGKRFDKSRRTWPNFSSKIAIFGHCLAIPCVGQCANCRASPSDVLSIFRGTRALKRRPSLYREVRISSSPSHFQNLRSPERGRSFGLPDLPAFATSSKRSGKRSHSLLEPFFAFY